MAELQKNRPKVGLGIIILSRDGRVLIKKRKGSLAPYYSIPGGNLEVGETFEAGAKREVKEETNLDIEQPEVIAVTNNLRTFREEGTHYISIILLAKNFSGELKNLEPDKCEELLWVDPQELPQPHFDASEMGIKCYLENVCYKKFD